MVLDLEAICIRWEASFFPPLKCLLTTCICHWKIKFGCSLQTASLRQDCVILPVEEFIQPWVVKVKGYRVRSCFLVTSAGPAKAWCFSCQATLILDVHKTNVGAWQEAPVVAKKPKQVIDCLLVKTCFISLASRHTRDALNLCLLRIFLI